MFLVNCKIKGCCNSFTSLTSYYNLSNWFVSSAGFDWISTVISQSELFDNHLSDCDQAATEGGTTNVNLFNMRMMSNVLGTIGTFIENWRTVILCQIINLPLAKDNCEINIKLKPSVHALSVGVIRRNNCEQI